MHINHAKIPACNDIGQNAISSCTGAVPLPLLQLLVQLQAMVAGVQTLSVFCELVNTNRKPV